MRGRNRVALVFAFMAVVPLAAASAQTPPPPSQPPPTRPTGPASTPPTAPQATPVTSGVQQAPAPSGPQALEAAGVLARETSALAALGAFGRPVPDRVATSVAGIDAGDDPSDEVERADADGVAQLSKLSTAGTALSRDVQQTLGPLGDADMAASREGRPISVEPEIYVRALAHLTQSNGGPPAAPVPPDPAAINAALRGLDLDAGRVSDGGGSDGGFPIAIVLVVLAALGVAAAALTFWRRRPAPTTAPIATPIPVPPSQAPPAGMQDLLEVSRRLTSAASTGDIDRAVLRDAVGLLRADGAALIRFQGDRLTVAAESEPELLVGEALDDGAIRRVAETGQPLVQVSATEPAIRHLPAALAAYPLVGGGRVEAVLVLLRNPSRPFNAADREVLQALAPVAAAALHSARQAKAAIEESLIDALTGVGNRRRFDNELAAALRDAAGAPTSLFICDLDRFKSVNDTYGHPAGDALLKQVAALMRDTIRPGDSLYRFGGEEFCALLRDTEAADAAEVAERVRAAVELRPFSIGGPEPLRATASFGVAAAYPADTDTAALLARADAALYEAKEGGRNRVVTS